MGCEQQVPPLRYAPVGMTIRLGTYTIYDQVLWYPTSREKRARYGAPGYPLQVEILKNQDRLLGWNYSSAATGEDFHQFLGRDNFQLGIGAIARFLVGTPAAKLRHVAEAGSLHVLVGYFDH
jgi:hypothetical protein